MKKILVFLAVISVTFVLSGAAYADTPAYATSKLNSMTPARNSNVNMGVRDILHETPRTINLTPPPAHQPGRPPVNYYPVPWYNQNTVIIYKDSDNSGNSKQNNDIQEEKIRLLEKYSFLNDKSTSIKKKCARMYDIYYDTNCTELDRVLNKVLGLNCDLSFKCDVY